MELRNSCATDRPGDVLRFLTKDLLDGALRGLLVILLKQADLVLLAIAQPGEVKFPALLNHQRFLDLFDLRTDDPAFAPLVGHLVKVHLKIAAGFKGHDLRVYGQS